MSTQSPFSSELALATDLALAAGALIREEFHRPGGPRSDGVSHAEVDTEAERLISEGLRKAFPGDAFRGEETGERGSVSARRQWLVDPNDGTRAFIAGHRGSAVSIALTVEGGLVLGVVYAPTAPDDGGDLITWAKGEPLRRNGAPVERPPLPGSLDSLSVVATNSDTGQKRLGWALSLAAPGRVLSRPSIAYRLALVAVGDADAAISVSGPTDYDVAGGHALLVAVGGVVLDSRGAPVRYGAHRTGGTNVFGGHPKVAALLAERAQQKATPLPSSRLAAQYPQVTPRHELKVRDAGVLSRVHGALLGQVAGDALGQLVEFSSARDILARYPTGVRELRDGGTWNTLAGQPTDDSELALMLARAIVTHGTFELGAVQEAYRAWLDSNPFDVGTTTRRGLMGGSTRDSESNGAAMRVSPLGVHFWRCEPDVVASFAVQDAHLSHESDVCLEASAVLAASIALAVREGPSPSQLFSRVASWVRASDVFKTSVRELFSADDVSPVDDFQHNQGWVLLALRNAFHQLLHAPSFEEALVRTVSSGGDTDTNGAIAGALLGAVHGRQAVPRRWQRAVLTCRATHGAHPRPPPFWATDLLELAERLVALGPVHQVEKRPTLSIVRPPAPLPEVRRSEKPRSGLRQAAGGVVVHPDGERVLLRRPTPNPGFDDLEWTHAKGRLDGQTLEEAAKREVREELGVEAEVLAELEGWYEGSTTANKYFVMRWVRDAGAFDAETAETRWFTWDEAVAAMRKGRNAKSVARDVAVLEAARHLLTKE